MALEWGNAVHPFREEYARILAALLPSKEAERQMRDQDPASERWEICIKIIQKTTLIQNSTPPFPRNKLIQNAKKNHEGATI